MDAHYHKVMTARDAIADTTPRLYFAYSGVLDRQAFEKWRTEHSYEFFNLPEGQVAQAVGVDLIFDFPSRWWGGRVAGLVDKKDAVIFGRLYEIPANNWPIVQHKEGVVSGMCIERTVTVMVDGKKLEATTFTTAPERASLDGEISPRYIEAMVRGARQSGLPEEYVQKLAQTKI